MACVIFVLLNDLSSTVAVSTVKADNSDYMRLFDWPHARYILNAKYILPLSAKQLLS